MKFVIVTGMSGAGKSTALKMLEDMGYFCVDNLPIPLLDKFASLALEHSEMNRIALGMDIRSSEVLGEELIDVKAVLEDFKEKKIDYEILFLDADDTTLVRRYKETRRRHPLSEDGRVGEGIEKERKEMAFFRQQADYIIDTSHLLTRELNKELGRIFIENGKFNNFVVNIVSFGFKYGIVSDADLVFDVRFLPNPYYEQELKNKTGNDEDVRNYVLSDGDGVLFLDKLEDMICFLIPRYISEGKSQLIIAVGCTGGKHRSVTIANGLYERLGRMKEMAIGLKAEHRDIYRQAR